MRQSSVLRTSLLMALIAGSAVTEATRERIVVRNFRLKIKVDWYDDERPEPYRISFRSRRVRSVYSFDASGSLSAIKVGNNLYEPAPDGMGVPLVESNTQNRMLLEEEMEADEMGLDHHRRRLYDCTDCEETWDTLCNVGLEEVCSIVDTDTSFFARDLRASLDKMCTKFTQECEASAESTCNPLCTEDACSADDPCENGGLCTVDPAGGHECSCDEGYGGMNCQIDTSDLAEFDITLEFVGDAIDYEEVFHDAAARWSEVITHVKCGTGDLTIYVIVGDVDDFMQGGGVAGGFGVSGVYGVQDHSEDDNCKSMALNGFLVFRKDGLDRLNDFNALEGLVLREMGHAIGIGVLWGSDYASCSSCKDNGSTLWTCPVAQDIYEDLGGPDANMIEYNGNPDGSSCSTLDESIFGDELMTGYTDPDMKLSKMTAAILEDMKYVVDPSVVDAYVLPADPETTTFVEESDTIRIRDTAVEAMIQTVDINGKVTSETKGVQMQF